MSTIKLSRTVSCNRAISYAEKRAEVKNSLNCDIDYAKTQMDVTRNLFEKNDGTQAHLCIQSFSPEESERLGAEVINKLGLRLANDMAPGHQVAVYTHTDKKHIHNHIVINSVDFNTGKKYHQNNDFKRVKALNDKISIDFNLEVPQPGKEIKKTMSEIKLEEKNLTPWKQEIRDKIDSVLSDTSVSSYKDFRERLESKGVITLDRGKNVTYVSKNKNKRVRGTKLGSKYTKNNINALIQQKKPIELKPTQTKPKNKPKYPPIKPKGFNIGL